MKKRRIMISDSPNDDAVVGIVVTVLLIGLLMAVMVMINTVYVPQWLEESEAAHMEVVSNQFAQLKYGLDIQSLVNDSTSVTSPVTLGSKELPIFSTGRTFGSLSIDKNSFNITIERWNSSEITSIDSDSIYYSSQNTYYVNQEYIYQAGMLILKQLEANVAYSKPSFSVEGYGNNSVMSFSLINISGLSGKTAISGFGTFPIYTQVSQFHPAYNQYLNLYNVTNITLYSDYTNAWNDTFASAFLHHFNESHYQLTEFENDRIEIRFNDPGRDYYHFRLKVVDILTQISSGIAE